MAFRQHLGTDEDIGLAERGPLQSFIHGALALCAVAVDARDIRVRKPSPEHVFESLRTLAERAHRLTALAAGFVERSRRAAMVATQAAVICMHGHAGVATSALCYLGRKLCR